MYLFHNFLFFFQIHRKLQTYFALYIFLKVPLNSEFLFYPNFCVSGLGFNIIMHQKIPTGFCWQYLQQSPVDALMKNNAVLCLAHMNAT